MTRERKPIFPAMTSDAFILDGSWSRMPSLEDLAVKLVGDRPEPLASTVEIALLIRKVCERMEIFLETVDCCDVLFYDKVGASLVFLVAAHREENLALIRNAIAEERDLLAEFAIDPHDVDLRDDVIRIDVPLPPSVAEASAS